jgi:UDP-N-acetylglucosamine/UDP-N-acetylgalactosamine diphosphorylase
VLADAVMTALDLNNIFSIYKYEMGAAMYQELYDRLKAYGQEHLLRFWDSLDDAGKEKLAGQINELDLEQLSELIKSYVMQKPVTEIPADLQPAPFYPLAPKDEVQKELYSKALAKGEELLKAGKVSALTVAGGQGTRLGFDGPKGTYPIAPVSGKTLFQYFAESLRRAGEKYGSELTWYIMTSLLNNEQTIKFFEDNNYFGMNPDKVVFFVQGTMPAIDYDGKLLLGDKDSLALAPDGHGGTLLALKKSGALARMEKEGVEYISYFQVDNPLVSVVNPLLIGLHALDKAEMSAIMLAKTGPFEKLGNFCVSSNRLEIIEYSDLPDELAEARNADGSLKFIAGSPAIHVISCDFVERLTAGGRLQLPWHRADKKIPFVNADGETTAPESPNGVKLESFIFDALPLAEKTMVLEADREEEFAPTKNKTGVDSVESCREMMCERDARRLERVGVTVPRDSEGKPAIDIEISPLSVIDDDDARVYCLNRGIKDLTDETKAVYLQ